MGIFELPDGYTEIKRINMQKDKKLAVLINIVALLIMVAAFFAGAVFVPVSFEIGGDNFGVFLVNAVLVLLAIVLYMFAHELIHGVFIKKYSGKKAKYGFTGMYAYAGSDAFFNKRQYIIIALAPVVLFGLVFLLLNIFLPRELFWGIYIIQMLNLSGAAGDLYITWLMGRLPADVLTNDEGFSMIIYSKAKTAL